MAKKSAVSETGWRARDTAADLAELEAGLKIDKHALDDECIDQPNRYFLVSEALTMAISQRDAAKQELAEVEAEVDADIRSNWDTEADGRLTEKMVESQKALNKDVARTKEELAQLAIKVGKLNALKDSYHQRRYMLQGLIDLHLGGYFGSAASAPRASRERGAEAAKAKHAERYKDSTHERRNARDDD
jgi:uncharacterized protein (DUF3084 family)